MHESDNSLSPAEEHVNAEEITEESKRLDSASIHETQDVETEVLGVETISRHINELKELFCEKIEVDSHKNLLFDNMHRELTSHRNALFQKPLIFMALDIVLIIDGLAKSINRLMACDDSTIEKSAFADKLLDISSDLSDVLYRSEFEAFQVEDNGIDTKRQKIVKFIETDDEALENTLAIRISKGYTFNDKVVRPELIGIYKKASKSNQVLER